MKIFLLFDEDKAVLKGLLEIVVRNC